MNQLRTCILCDAVLRRDWFPAECSGCYLPKATKLKRDKVRPSRSRQEKRPKPIAKIRPVVVIATVAPVPSPIFSGAFQVGTVAHLYYIEHLPIEEISQRLGISLRRVGGEARKAYRQAQRELEKTK